MSQSTIPHAMQIAVQHHQAGRLDEAAGVYRQVLSRQPDHVTALHLLGLVCYANRQLNAAEDLIKKAIAIDPRAAEPYSNLSNVLKDQGKLDEALAAAQKAIALKPEMAEFHNNLANVLKDQKKLDQAAAALDRAMQLKPGDPAHLSNLGNIRQLQGRLDDALAAYQRAIEIDPRWAGAHHNIGIVLREKGNFAQAIASHEAAMRLAPQSAAYCNALGVTLAKSFQFPRAIEVFRKAAALDPAMFGAHVNLGNACKDVGDFKNAADAFARAIQLRPGHAEVRINYCNVIMQLGRIDESITGYLEVIAMKPNLALAYLNLALPFKEKAMLDESIAANRKALELNPHDEVAARNLIYTMLFHNSSAGAVIFAELQKWNAHYARPLRDKIPIHRNDRNPNRRLRIGYISPDFRDHCQMFFMLPLLANHDRSQVEIYCYSMVGSPDSFTAKHQALADVWRPIYALDDEAAAKLIQEDRIDILFDLTLHMCDNRLRLFARKPAPVQITWLGYPGSTGVKAIDYRLTDPHLDPPGLNDAFYSEKSLYLPDTFWCYDPLEKDLPVNDLPALQNGYITFGCLNNFCKINAETLRLWAAVMREVANSRLILLSPLGSARQWVLGEFSRHGISADRIRFEHKLKRRNYLELYHQIDLVLDTYIYNGHTTSLDGLWMGVPMVTRYGQPAVSRAGLSQLTNLNLQHLASDTEAGFIANAVSLASDLPALRNLRKTLRSRIEASPLMDAKKFARGFEDVCRSAWRTWCET